MGAKDTRCSTGTKGSRWKFLSTLHPNTIFKPNPDPNTHPNPRPTPTPTPNPNPSPNPRLGLALVLGSKMESNGVAKGSHERNLEDLA